MKISLAAWQKDNIDPSILSLRKLRAFNLNRLSIAICILHPDCAVSAQLDSIAEDSASIEMVHAKAGTGVSDLQQPNGASGAVFDGGLYVCRMAPGHGQYGRNC